MGHGNSKAYTEAIKKLSSLELNNIVAVFNELSTENQDGTRAIPEPNMATRRVFAERFSLPGLIGERLFHAFDRDNNGTINLEEFVGGVALCLHGSAQAKCELLFKVFNFSDDEDSVTEDELKTILLSSLQSANTILDSVGGSESKETPTTEKPLIETVTEIVQDAFKTCDKSKNGKLSAKEFSTWLHKNPQIMDNVFGWQCPKPELGHWANEADLQGSKSLQELFGGQNISGESFFDSLGSAAVVVEDANASEGDRKSANTSPVPLSPTHKSKNSSVSEDVEVSTEANPSASQATVKTGSPVKTEPRLSEVEDEEPFIETYDYYSAMWMPCEETSAFLQAIRNSTLKPENAEIPEVRVPSVQFETPQVDPVKELVAKYLNVDEASPRAVLTEDMVTPDSAGLKQLLRAECWRSALNLTTRLLTATNVGQQTASQLVHSPSNLEIWFCRIAMFYQLNMYSAADVELEAFGNLDAAVLYYEFYPDLYPGKEGTMIPFCFRILAAMLPQHLDRPNEALDKLFHLHSVCLQVLRNLSAKIACSDDIEEALQKGMELWQKRLLKVLYCIGNTFLSMKEYVLAISVFKQIAKRDSENSRALLSGIGRISLQSGDIESAQGYFKSAEEMNSDDDAAAQSDAYINRGLLALTVDAYEEAYKHFTAAKNLDPQNSIAVNNAAVSLLFQGRLKEALKLLEDLVFKDPEKNLQPGILFNICTMYELKTSRHMQKKQSLLDLIAQHRGDGFNVSCLKFP